uniref:Gfo/Idh/MocA-like oxidoreductase N-terminal domain-containing protein n=1 Tax=Odontella aurita TaxID=265563 RepID=A0A7S4M6G3_9STRA|mmetsp:Transcript_12143/g.35518  ORF Transcript_12143/g.35518 Transcript_12143/m.35518 type:complete len:345 (+) Transcript_12143:178-1212(+)
MSASPTRRPRVFVVIGCGEIARAQHIPLVQSRSDTLLGAVVDPNPNVKEAVPPGVSVFSTLREAIDGSAARSRPLDAAVVSTPPAFSPAYIREALEAGLDVLAEKPAGMDHGVLSDLATLAAGEGLVLFAAYHSIECPAMDLSRGWVRDNGPVAEARIEWKEDAAKWHAGQEWVKGGFGVLDIVINPLSIVFDLLGATDVHLAEGSDSSPSSSELRVPENWEGPVSGWTELSACGSDGVEQCRISADYDWSHRGEDIWTIRFRARDGSAMEVRDGGVQMYVNGRRVTVRPTSENKIRPEYEKLYEKFMGLVDSRECDVNVLPLRVICEILSASNIKRVHEYSLG